MNTATIKEFLIIIVLFLLVLHMLGVPYIGGLG